MTQVLQTEAAYMTSALTVWSPIECDSDMENMACYALWNSDPILCKGCLFFRYVRRCLSSFAEQKNKQPITFAEIIIISISEVLRESGLVCVFGKSWWLRCTHSRTPLPGRGCSVLMLKYTRVWLWGWVRSSDWDTWKETTWAAIELNAECTGGWKWTKWPVLGITM